MTYSILLTFDKVDVKRREFPRYERLQEVIAEISKKHKHFRILSTHAIQIPLNIPLEQIGQIVSLLGDGIQYKYAIVSEDLAWFDTETNI